MRIPVATVGSATCWLEITFDSDAVVGRRATHLLKQMEDRLKNPGDLMPLLAKQARRMFRDNFAAGGRPSWAPLKQRTVGAKARMLKAGMIPQRTRSGKIPKRLLQRGTFSANTILIQSGGLRDSYAQSGARGHVEEWRGSGGSPTFFVGSQYQVVRQLSPDKPLQQYHVVSKKARGKKARGHAVTVGVPLARIHDEGAPRANIPARPQFAEGRVLPEDLTAIIRTVQDWLLGTGTGVGT